MRFESGNGSMRSLGYTSNVAPSSAQRRARLLGSVAGTVVLAALLSPLAPARAADGDGGSGSYVFDGDGVGGAASVTGTGVAGGAGASDTSSRSGGGGGSGSAGGNGGDASFAGGLGGAGGSQPGQSGGDGGDGQQYVAAGGGGGGGAHGYVGVLGDLPGSVSGGNGGNGGEGVYGGGGGGGGFGAVITGLTGETGTIAASHAETITGGNGGNHGWAATGGNGGSGLVVYQPTGDNTLTIGAALTGGNGGGPRDVAGVGGNGGSGFVLDGAAGDTAITFEGAVTGGSAGLSWASSSLGGNGILLTNTTGDTTLVIKAAVTGGAGGETQSQYASAGIGGAGIDARGSTGATHILVQSSVTGGASGEGANPTGGAGITGANLSIVLDGAAASIAGGSQGSGTAAAIAFTGGTNTLELRADGDGALGTITGAVTGAGTSDRLVLGGSNNTSAAFTGTLGTLAASGFGTLEKSGSSAWTITEGSVGDGMAVLVSAGTLKLTGAATLADATGVTVNGTLDLSGLSAATTIANLSGTQAGAAITAGATGLTIDQTTADTYAGSITGTGTLTKMGSATLTLTKSLGYEGAVAISEGTLKLTGAGSLADAASVTVDGTLDISSLSSTTRFANLSGGSGGNIVIANELTIDQSENGTYAGAFSGGFGVAKAGTGTLTLTGAFDYDGYIVSSGGTIEVRTTDTISFRAITLGAESGVASLIVGRKEGETAVSTLTTTFGGINVGGSGTGALTIESGGVVKTPAVYVAAGSTLTLSGNATDGRGVLETSQLMGDAATTGVTFDGGVLRATGNEDYFIYLFGADTITLAAGGGYIDSKGFSIGAEGVFTGAGALVKQGEGTLTFYGANSYTGGTVIEAGTLALSGAGALSPTGSLALVGETAVFDITAATGAVTVGALSGTATGATLALGAKSFTTTVTADSVYAGAITGSGSFTKAGSAALTLNGVSSFDGLMTVSGGKLVVGDAAHPGASLAGGVLVGSGATLGGIGTTGSVQVAAGGTLAPGNSIGTYHVAGDVTFAAGSTYEVEIAGNGDSDLISATGTATINGAALKLIALDPQASYVNGQSYTILEAAGGVNGAFGEVTTSALFLTAQTDPSATGVDVVITVTSPDPFTSVAATPNQYATATALGTLPQTGPSLALYNSLLFLTSASEARWAFDQLSGEVHASTQSLFMEQSSLIRGALNDRLRAAQGGVGAASGPVVALDETTARAYAAPGAVQSADASKALNAVAAPATTERFAFWTTGFGNWGEMDGTGNAAAVSDSTGGFLIGADAMVGDGWRLGVAGGYSDTAFSISGRNASGSSENWHAGLYGGRTWGPLALRAGLAYTLQDISTSRSVAFTGYRDNLSADYDAGTVQAFGELGYRIDAAGIAFEPFANLAYVSLHQDGYREQGGAAALTGDAQTMATTFTTLGLRLARDVALGPTTATLRGSVGWRHAFGDVLPTVTQAFAGSDAFTITGAPIAQDAAVLEAGLDMRLAPGATLGVAYTGQFGDGVSDNGFNARLSVRF
ncbi:autotransporter domain-containing protein [Xanthobacter tagetidis]|uniref:Autotransporter domain-containing protein n=2 Tax=Xanthobacter tagetidis TaxID=60216 RepID=A0A3L7AES8_9HYPH|nr:autotransporter domain-containing protein [Xanthobacter tagetidis]